jgi:tetratricopeptide (TPR) repeat protein
LLNLPGEREWPVAPLPTPQENARLEECPSSALFLDRARAARPSFALTPENAPDIIALCRHLDGIPLALELAAARIRVLTPAQILERLRQQLDFLQTREHGVPERQRTLRATIEWSYHQLPPGQQQFFNSLSVFRGGWMLEAAEEICAPEDGDVLDFLERLREYSMITTQDTPSGTRFRMLEVLREWGAAKLDSEQLPPLRAAHFAYFLQFIESANDAFSLAQRRIELEAESDNFRHALAWALERDDAKSANDASRLAGGLCPWWESRALYSEGREWVLRVLRKDGDVEPQWRALLLRGAGSLSLCCGDLAPAQSLLEEALLLSRSLGDPWGEAYILHRLSVALMLRGQLETATRYAEQSLESARKIGDPALLFGALIAVSWAYHNTERHAEGQVVMHECLDLAKRLGVRQIEALNSSVLGYSHALTGEFVKALEFAGDGVRIAQENPEVDGWCRAITLAMLAVVSREAQNYDLALRTSPVVLREFFRIGSRWEVVSALNDCAMLAADMEQWDEAAQLFGAADALGERIGYRLLLSISCLRTPRFQKLQQVLGEAELQKQMHIGAQLPLETAIETAQQLQMMT